MSNSNSAELINYGLRPGKNIERKMMCEAFTRLSSLESVANYRYIGFGGLGFYDFSLFHNRLGIIDMVSIEKKLSIRARAKFNKPLRHIKQEWNTANSILRKLSWDKRTITWLDYDGYLKSDYLVDLQLVTSQARSGSIVIISCNCNPKTLHTESDPEKRLEIFKSQVGSKRIPPSIKPRDLNDWGLANICRDLIDNEIHSSLNQRNLSLTKPERLKYTQLFNFNYADGARMLTVGGIFLNDDDQKKLQMQAFTKLSFIKKESQAFLINTPNLTIREMRYLESIQIRPGKRPNWLPAENVKSFKRLQRHFPTFAESEIK